MGRTEHPPLIANLGATPLIIAGVALLNVSKALKPHLDGTQPKETAIIKKLINLPLIKTDKYGLYLSVFIAILC